MACKRSAVRSRLAPPAFAGYACFGWASPLVAKAAPPKPTGAKAGLRKLELACWPGGAAGGACFGWACPLVAKAASPKPKGAKAGLRKQSRPVGQVGQH